MFLFYCTLKCIYFYSSFLAFVSRSGLPEQMKNVNSNDHSDWFNKNDTNNIINYDKY